MSEALTTLAQPGNGLGTGIMLVILISLFTGLFLWAWSDRRKPVFQRAGQLPLEEDDVPVTLQGQQSPSDTTGKQTHDVIPDKPVIIHADGIFTRPTGNERKQQN